MPHVATLNRLLGPAATVSASEVTIHDEAALASSRMDDLVQLAVFGTEIERDWARWAICP